ncbi:MAG: tetratricopeptide repeat protein, partial [Planctomycetota bacterium]|nr:tetratricopeptide repeat protein [Planctomycetota bacterium]
LVVDPQGKNNKYEEAVKDYTSAAENYRGQPESLEAYVRTASCYRKMKRLDEAKTALDQAMKLMNSIPKEADFQKTTRYSREEWLAYLDVLDKL